MDIHDIIVRPVVTEKGTHQSERLNAYAFVVHPDAGHISYVLSPRLWQADNKKALKPKGWNDYEVNAVGPRITLAINGEVLVDYTEKDAKIARSGVIAPQVHSGGPLEVQFRNLRIKEITK